ncbi:unnamed protein product [Caenorhabditis angaria]|uniref:Domain of unknown function DX domain-containing protein n=1 Tax=Caenorhabditis angaria TaxID=860376 RepID=A0A9P1IJS7_9PELO|nr:unnamed protein product [Caenorhabditis angaria]
MKQMWSNKYLAFFLVVLLHASICLAEETYTTCPYGSSDESFCETGVAYVFYGIKECCPDETPCKFTGMASQYVAHEYSESFWYARNIHHCPEQHRKYLYQIDEDPLWFVCPIPIAYIWADQYDYNTRSPNIFLPTNPNYITEKIVTCQKNSDCDINQYCGNVINPLNEGGYLKENGSFSMSCNVDFCDMNYENWTLMEKTQKFCYWTPPLPINTGIEQFHIDADKPNLSLCDKNADCDENSVCAKQYDIDGKLLTWTGYIQPTSEYKFGKRKSYEGLCIESKPVAYLFYSIFKKLDHDNKIGEIGKQYLPVDWKNGTHKSKMKKCAKNGDCAENEFCSNIYSLNEDNGNFDETNTFCFKFPIMTPKDAVDSNKVGIKACTTDENCDSNQSCLKGYTKYLEFENGKRVEHFGLCISSSNNSTTLIIIIIVTTCPYGEADETFCETGVTYLFNNEYWCCPDETPCKFTGMTSKYIVDMHSTFAYARNINHGINAHNKYIYQVNEDPLWFACPIPVAYVWADQYDYNTRSPPKIFLPTNPNYITEKIVTCQKNSDCGINQYCGNVINPLNEGGYLKSNGSFSMYCNSEICNMKLEKWTLMEKIQKFCYWNPLIPIDIGIEQFHTDADKPNLSLCDKNADCDENSVCAKQYDIDGKLLTWTGYIQPTSEYKFGKRKSYEGLCIESKPVAYLFYSIFKKLDHDNKIGEIGKQYLPVDWKNGTHKSKMKKCAKNGDCAENEFCSNIYSLNEDNGNFDETNTFCFKLPTSDPPQNYDVDSNKVGIKACTTDENCDSNQSCLKGYTKYLEFENGKRVEHFGLCISSSNNSTTLIIIIIVVCVLIFIAIILIGGFLFWKLKIKKHQKSSSKMEPISPSTQKSVNNQAA